MPRLSGRTRASGDPAENRRSVRNGTVIIGGIALSAARSKLQRHEDTVRVVRVIAERFAIAEATNGVEPASRSEERRVGKEWRSRWWPDRSERNSKIARVTS